MQLERRGRSTRDRHSACELQRYDETVERKCRTSHRNLRMSTGRTFLIVLFLGTCLVECREEEGVLNKITSGLQYAKSYLDTAREIADLVSNSLGQKNVNNNERLVNDKGKRHKNPRDSAMPSLISGFVRLLGLDSPRITAIAVNSVIFLAQMISSLFNMNPELESARGRSNESPFDPLQFIVGTENNWIQHLLHQAKDPALPDQLIERLDGIDSSCVKLLICKTSPIILAAQNSLKLKTSGRKLNITSWLPTKQSFEETENVCEEKYNECNLFAETT